MWCLWLSSGLAERPFRQVPRRQVLFTQNAAQVFLKGSNFPTWPQCVKDATQTHPKTSYLASPSRLASSIEFEVQRWTTALALLGEMRRKLAEPNAPGREPRLVQLRVFFFFANMFSDI